MDDVGSDAERLNRLQHREIEENESLGIIRVISPTVSVDAVPVEIPRLVDQVEWNV